MKDSPPSSLRRPPLRNTPYEVSSGRLCFNISDTRRHSLLVAIQNIDGVRTNAVDQQQRSLMP